MFEKIQPAPPDAILGLTEAFNADANPRKINLGVGVYKDANGQTPVLDSVKAAERRLLESEKSKNYMPIDGSPKYAGLVQGLLFGNKGEAVASGRSATLHTPGGTGALRVTGDYLRANHGQITIHMSDPTWPNHPQIFEAAGLKVATYPYFDPATNGLKLDEMLKALDKVPAGDAVLLHGCCHNPTGVDLPPEVWKQVAGILAKRGALPVIDFAYQGFADGLQQDAQCLEAFVTGGSDFMVCSSFSKNFGLYNERVGALTLVASNKERAAAVLSQAKRVVRANYSNPPAHGASIVTTILEDAALRRQWEEEVKQMRDRINHMRSLFVDTLKAKGVRKDMSFIARQRGMFSFSGLTKAQVDKLRTEHAVYVVGSGRISVAGMTDANMDALCGAIARVMG
ncbi:MAG: aminotransferase class I/II-fold pyridoxal phosphate-dependent enzyme [Phycisphaera sp.]|nr:aminotransferase class I/II-fold pyridoxal phosphate-dependent enzyme [Phycisphaera sp.]